jgi:hypothetical protein
MMVTASLLAAVSVTACQRQGQPPVREALERSGWIEDAAVQRGHIRAGDVARFGCPPGWLGVEDTAAALRGQSATATYMGTAPPPHEGTITCVAQREFELPPRYPSQAPQRSMGRPLAPVWVEIAADRTTIGFRSELESGAPIYIARETPCGPRVIGVRLGDLLKWLSDPQSAKTRDFLGMESAGCPEQSER